MNNNAYVIAGILFLISLPILLIWGIVSVAQELRRGYSARRQGKAHTWNRSALLSGVGAILFVLLSLASGLVYAGMSYKVLPRNLYWLVVTLGVLAVLAGVLYVSQLLPMGGATQEL